MIARGALHKIFLFYVVYNEPSTLLCTTPPIEFRRLRDVRFQKSLLCSTIAALKSRLFLSSRPSRFPAVLSMFRLVDYNISLFIIYVSLMNTWMTLRWSSFDGLPSLSLFLSRYKKKASFDRNSIPEPIVDGVPSRYRPHFTPRLSE